MANGLTTVPGTQYGRERVAIRRAIASQRQNDTEAFEVLLPLVSRLDMSIFRQLTSNWFAFARRCKVENAKSACACVCGFDFPLFQKPN